ncbi:MAG TPA: hypothetical protein ENI62_02710 [Gammaproteobacteria bacterium]|nr:hypothetical protein [Gammaproteobacteria bacterium]
MNVVVSSVSYRTCHPARLGWPVSPQARREYLFHLIPPEGRDKVTFVRQFGSKNISIAAKFQQARQLIDLYSQAKLVLTSRIHCALPCLALGTPVIFLHSDLDRSTDSARLGGLLELMRVFDLHELKAGADVPAGFYANTGAIHEKIIDWDNPAPNPVDIDPIADRLRKTCQGFISG